MIITILWFILILGITIFVHELGHFLFAKKSGIYVYEFALGMGPKIWSFKRKNDETEYAIRAIPLGGFVSMAGEEIDDDKKVPKEKKFQSKTFIQKFMTVIAGVLFNFIFAIMILFVVALIYGAPDNRPIIGEVDPDYPAYKTGIETGDIILSIDDQKISTWDDLLLIMEINDKGNAMDLEVQKLDNNIMTYTITPEEYLEEDGTTRYILGISSSDSVKRGLWVSIKYSFEKFGSLIKSMGNIIKGLVFGDISVNKLSGPVGIYTIVGDSAEAGFGSVLYLLAFLSINVGFINFLPIPAFDGGRLVFIIISAITKKEVNRKVENIIHMIGFVLLIGLMLLVTYNDILKLF